MVAISTGLADNAYRSSTTLTVHRVPTHINLEVVGFALNLLSASCFDLQKSDPDPNNW